MTRVYLWLRGLEADRPLPGIQNRLYFATDTGNWFIDNGTSWDAANLTHRGTYSAATAYYNNDLVTYNGSTWRALQGVTGVTPVEGVNWTIFAAKGDTGATGGTGSTGATGPPAYTTTSASFTQPAASSNVTVTVGSTSWMAAGQYIYVSGGGYYTLSSITDATHAVLTNLGYTGNAAPGATVSSGAGVSPGGIQGATGATGGVASFNTRTGAVVPASGDYNYSQISSAPAIASQAQADAGTDDATIMTPLKVASRPQKNVVFETFVHGLNLTWNTPGTNGTNLTVTPGAAWIPSLGRIYNVSSTITGPSMTFAASTMYYVYLYDNSGTPAIDISTTATTAYKDAARQKSGDNSRRFIGAVLTDGAGSPAMRAFEQRDKDIHYTTATAATPYRVLNGVTAASATSQSLATICPAAVTTDVFGIVVGGQATGTYAFILGLNSSVSTTTNFNGQFQWVLGTTGFTIQAGWLPIIPATPSLYYLTSQPATATFSFDVRGYRIAR